MPQRGNGNNTSRIFAFAGGRTSSTGAEYKKPVICIVCRKKWEVTCSTPYQSNSPSSGLCDICQVQTVTPVIRRRQLKEGNFDCFGKAVGGFCDQSNCKYLLPCLHLSAVAASCKESSATFHERI